MLVSRLFLILVILMLAGFGIGSLLNPGWLAGLVGFEMGTTTARSDIRAFYGGIEPAPAVFLIWCLLDPSRVRFALGFTGLVFGFVAAPRGLGMLPDRPVTSVTVTAFAVEAAPAVIALVLAGRMS